MAKQQSQEIPENYKQLEGSERHPSKTARLIGPANDNEVFKVTIILRRRLDGSPIPDFDYYAKTPLKARTRLSTDEFAKKYGAHTDEIKKVVKFIEDAGLKVIETRPERRTIIVSGTTAQMSNAFAVPLNNYEHEIVRGGQDKTPIKEIYRGRDGFIYVPQDLA